MSNWCDWSREVAINKTTEFCQEYWREMAYSNILNNPLLHVLATVLLMVFILGCFMWIYEMRRSKK